MCEICMDVRENACMDMCVWICMCIYTGESLCGYMFDWDVTGEQIVIVVVSS